jgi:two-component system, sensor histidine kinase and response regulator
LRGDSGRIRQILTNLIGNAVKFTEKGEVVVRVSKESETERHVRVEFRIEDTGIGISQQAQKNLFQAFNQADGSTTRRYGGTGLGLAIAKQLTALMKGEIGVKSEPGRGAVFWFTAELEKQVNKISDPDSNRRDLAGASVLVVDDNATNRRILLLQLQSWKVEVQTASGGGEALNMLRAAAQAGRPYRMALLDVQMPAMDGWMLARIIQTDANIKETRLVILTSVGQAVGAGELDTAGIEAYLVKPVKQARLLGCLMSVIGKSEIENVTLKLTEPSPNGIFSGPGLPSEKVHILLAEDNIVNQKVALGQLLKLGYRADPVTSGVEVLEAVKRIPYDFILMDCQMPQMDGYEATLAIRQLEQSAEFRCSWSSPMYIIAMTAHAMQGDREKCLAAGMDDYLSKPVRGPELQAALERGKRAAQGRSQSAR